VGNTSLKDLFPRLFQVSEQKECFVRDVGRWDGPNWRCDFKWRWNLFVWEEELVGNLKNLLNQINISQIGEERKCHHSRLMLFMVFYPNLSPPPVALNVEKLSFLEHLWKIYASSKVIVFS
jgi:hypothetical protein